MPMNGWKGICMPMELMVASSGRGNVFFPPCQFKFSKIYAWKSPPLWAAISFGPFKITWVKIM
jgi:hypothetical protein